MRVLTSTTSIRLRSEMYQQLQRIAERERIPVAQLTRSALGELIESYRDKYQRKVSREAASMPISEGEG